MPVLLEEYNKEIARLDVVMARKTIKAANQARNAAPAPLPVVPQQVPPAQVINQPPHQNQQPLQQNQQYQQQGTPQQGTPQQVQMNYQIPGTPAGASSTANHTPQGPTGLTPRSTPGASVSGAMSTPNLSYGTPGLFATPQSYVTPQNNSVGNTSTGSLPGILPMGTPGNPTPSAPAARFAQGQGGVESPSNKRLRGTDGRYSDSSTLNVSGKYIEWWLEYFKVRKRDSLAACLFVPVRSHRQQE